MHIKIQTLQSLTNNLTKNVNLYGWIYIKYTLQ
jgi:hypothetical protein